MMLLLDTLPPLLAAFAASLAAVWDLRTGRIPNWLTFPIIGIAPLLHTASGGVPSGLLSIASVFVCGFVPWLVHRLTKGRAMGGGDVKLFAALGGCVGATTGLELQFLSYVIVSVFALMQLTWRGRLLVCLKSSVRLALNPLLPMGWRRDVRPELLTSLRVGPAVCAATLLVSTWELTT